MQVWIWCPYFHEIGVWTTHIPTRKIPKRDSWSHASRTDVNVHEIVGIRLDDINKHTQGRMHEHVGKHAKMQRNKES